jgi:uncharacterized protein (TIGR04222 family)
MFPFDLSGPHFLQFYLLLAVAVLSGLYFARRLFEGGETPMAGRTDPYLYACLAGGPKAVIRVATVGLIDRGLLHVSGNLVSRSLAAVPGATRSRVEQAILHHFQQTRDAPTVLQSAPRPTGRPRGLRTTAAPRSSAAGSTTTPVSVVDLRRGARMFDRHWRH